MVLNNWQVDKGTSNFVDDVTDESTETSWNGINSHVWSSKGSKVADLSVTQVASGGDVTSKESSLGKSHNIDFWDTSEVGVSLNVLEGHLSLSLKVGQDGGESSVTDLNAVSVVSSSRGNLLGESSHSTVDASISQSVENSSWDGLDSGCGQSKSKGSHVIF